MGVLRAFARLVYLRFARSGLSPLKPTLASGGQAVANLVVPLLVLLAIAYSGYTLGQQARSSESARGWLLLGLFALTLGAGATSEALPRGIDRAHSPLAAHPLLHPLPISQWVRPVLGLCTQPTPIAVVLTALLACADPAPQTWLVALFFCTLVLLGGALTGVCVLSLLRLVLRPHLIPTASLVVSLVGSFGGFMLGLSAARVGPLWGPFLLLRFPARALSSVLLQESIATLSLGILIPFPAIMVLAAVLFWWAERKGYDQTSGGPQDRPRQQTGDLNIPRVSRILSARDFARPSVLLGLQACVLASSAIGAVLFGSRVWAAEHFYLYLWLVSSAILGGQLLFVLLQLRAERLVSHDLGARPLLATLPLEPRALLQGKAAALQRLVVPFSLVLVPWGFVLPRDVGLMVFWRSAAAAAVFSILAEGLVSTTFLRRAIATGASSPNFDLGTYLLLIPVYSVLFAPTIAESVLGLLLLGGVALEARKAARRAVRWLDDADEAVERDTDVWRAMLVLALFFAIQSLGNMVVTLAYKPKPRGFLIVGFLIVTVISQLQLGSQTIGRKGLEPQLPDSLRGWFLAPVGLLAGALSGCAALGYLALLRSYRIATPAGLVAQSSGLAWWLLLAVIVVCAPLVEELFFRGWLQPALERELSPSWSRYAFVVAAVAFAAVHGLVSFMPVLLLGLVAGLLRRWTGNILASILAHAAHNAIAMLLAN